LLQTQQDLAEAGKGRVCFPEFFADPGSWNIAQELSFKLAPRVKEAVPGKDVYVQRVSDNKDLIQFIE
jgi:hypothetical protein